MPIIGILVVGLLWSFTVMWLNAEELVSAGLKPTRALVYVTLGGLVQTIAFWAGFSAVLWAMVRAFSGHISFIDNLALTSSASWPFWVGAPATAIWLSSGNAVAAIIAILGLGAFLYSTSSLLSLKLDWTIPRSMATTVSAAVFLVSFVYLTIS